MDPALLPPLRTALKSAAQLRELLFTVNLQLLDFGTELDRLDPSGPGVEGASDWLSSTLDLLRERLRELHSEELEIHRRLGRVLEAEDR